MAVSHYGSEDMIANWHSSVERWHTKELMGNGVELAGLGAV